MNLLKTSGYSHALRACKVLSEEISEFSSSKPVKNQTPKTERLCSICKSMPQKYVCPRCNAPYCSLPCYKSPVHSNCSEAFYQECVMTEMKSTPIDHRPVVEILERAYTQSQQDLAMDIFENDGFPSSDEDSDDDGDDNQTVMEHTIMSNDNPTALQTCGNDSKSEAHSGLLVL